MPHPKDAEITQAMRINAVINNPHITDWFFCSKVSDFVKHWLIDTLDSEWYWLRYEYQAQGSTHAHGCAKLRNDPNLCNLVHSAALGWLEEKAYRNAVANNCEHPLNNHIILYGKHAEAQAIQYANWLVTTMNQCLPENSPSTSMYKESK